jgi:hypothetical protein
MPPGMAYSDDATDDAAAEPGLDEVASSNLDGGEVDDADLASTDLPAFLTDDEPTAAALNGAAAP